MPRNLLVVVVDCLRADHVAADRPGATGAAEPSGSGEGGPGASGTGADQRADDGSASPDEPGAAPDAPPGGEHADTPFLDELREDGLDVRSMYATATTTTPAVGSLLTGTYSETNGLLSLSRGTLEDDVATLASVFGDAGYHTSARVTGPLVEDTGLDRDVEDYQVRDPRASLFTDWRAEARDWLSGLPEPFAALLHCWEIHEDVHVPRAYDRARYGATPYARALSALDRELASLVEAAPDGTVLAVTGDHGESITHRHNPLRLGAKALRDAVRYYGGVDTRPAVRRLNRALADRGPDVPDHVLENGHGENAFEYAARVPFVLSGPGVERATVRAQVRQVDALPTLCDALDVPVPEGIDGESLLPADAVVDRPAYVRACGASLHRRRNWARAVRYDGAKYVEFPDRDWAPALYDLEADPLELSPVVDEALARRLRRHLPDAELGDGEALDVAERLRDLGYR